MKNEPLVKRLRFDIRGVNAQIDSLLKQLDKAEKRVNEINARADKAAREAENRKAYEAYLAREKKIAEEYAKSLQRRKAAYEAYLKKEAVLHYQAGRKKFKKDYEAAKAEYAKDQIEYQKYLAREQKIAERYHAQKQKKFEADYKAAQKSYSQMLAAYRKYLADEEKIANKASLESAKADLRYEKYLQKRLQEQEDDIQAVADSAMRMLRRGTDFILRELGEAFRQATEYIKEYDAIINSIAIVLQDYGRAQQLGEEYEQLAKTLKSSSIDIAKAAEEIFRQGVDESEVVGRLTAVSKYAKISGLEFKDSVDIMTAALNNFRKKGEDGVTALRRISDVWSYLGDATATGADEIGTAMQKVAGTAATAEMSLEKISSYIAIISSQTREAPENIGTGLNSILSRYMKVTEAGWSRVVTDDDGEDLSINQIDLALQKANITVLDANKNFRAFDKILDELYPKWDSLDDVTKKYIATQIAGTRNMNRFLVLMNNYDKALALYEGALNSAGTTNEKYAIYLESVAAAQDAMTASLQDLYSTVLSSGVIKDWYNAWAGFFEALSTATKGSHGINIALAGIAASLVLLRNAMLALKSVGVGSGIKAVISGLGAVTAKLFGVQAGALAATGALTGMQVAIGATGVGLAVLGLSALFGAIKNAGDFAAKAAERISELNVEMEALSSTRQQLVEAAESIKRIGEKANYTSTELDEFRRVRDLIAESSPDLIEKFRLEGEGLEALAGYYEKLSTAAEQASKRMLMAEWSKAYEARKDTGAIYDSAINKKGKKNPVYEDLANTKEYIDPLDDRNYVMVEMLSDKTLEGISQSIKFLENQLAASMENVRRYTGTLLDNTSSYVDMMNILNEEINKLNEEAKSIPRGLFGRFVGEDPDADKRRFDAITQQINDYKEALELIDAMNAKHDLLQKKRAEKTSLMNEIDSAVASTLGSIISEAIDADVIDEVPARMIAVMKASFSNYDFGDMTKAEIIDFVRNIMLQYGAMIGEYLDQGAEMVEDLDVSKMTGAMYAKMKSISSEFDKALLSAKLDPSKMDNPVEDYIEIWDEAYTQLKSTVSKISGESLFKKLVDELSAAGADTVQVMSLINDALASSHNGSDEEKTALLAQFVKFLETADKVDISDVLVKLREILKVPKGDDAAKSLEQFVTELENFETLVSSAKTYQSGDFIDIKTMEKLASIYPELAAVWKGGETDVNAFRNAVIALVDAEESRLIQARASWKEYIQGIKDGASNLKQIAQAVKESWDGAVKANEEAEGYLGRLNELRKAFDKGSIEAVQDYVEKMPAQIALGMTELYEDLMRGIAQGWSDVFLSEIKLAIAAAEKASAKAFEEKHSFASLMGKAQDKLSLSKGGNVAVDVTLRPKIVVDENVRKQVESFGAEFQEMLGSTMTLFSSTYSFEDGTALLVTPILPNGEMLTSSELEDYISELELGGIENVLKNDRLGLVIGVFDSSDAEANINNAQEAANALHNLHNAQLEDAKVRTEAFKASLEYLEKLQSAIETYDQGGLLDPAAMEELANLFPTLNQIWSEGQGDMQAFREEVIRLGPAVIDSLKSTYPEWKQYLSYLDKSATQNRSLIQIIKDVTNKNTAATTAITKLRKGYSLLEDDVSALLNDYPELTDELIAFARGAKSAAEFTKDLESAMQNKTLRENAKIWEDTIESMKEMRKGSLEYNQALETLGNTFAAGFGEQDPFTFAKNNLKDIEAAVNGNVEAFRRLQKAAFVNITGRSDVDFSDVNAELLTVEALGEEAYNTLIKMGLFEEVTRFVPSYFNMYNPVSGKIEKMPVYNRYTYLQPTSKNPFSGGKKRTSGGGGRGGGGSPKKSTSSSSVDVSNIYQKQLDEQSEALDEIDHRLRMAQAWQKYYEARGELTKAIPYMKEELEILQEKYELSKKNAKSFREQADVLKGQKDYTEDLITQYTAQRDKYAKNSKKWKEWNNKIKQLKKVLAQLEEDYEAMNSAANEAAKTEVDLATAIEEGNKALEERRRTIRQTKIDVHALVNQYIQDLKNQERAMLDATVSMQNTILDIMRENAEEQLDIQRKTLEDKRSLLEEELDAIRKNFDEARKMAEEDSRKQELESKQKQLAAIMLDPTRAKERAALEKEIAELRSELAWDAAEEEIAARESAIQAELDAIDDQIEQIEKAMDKISKYSAEMIKEMQDLLKKSDKEILAWLQANCKEYIEATDEARTQMTRDWEESLNEMRGAIETNWDEVERMMAEGLDSIIEMLQNTTAFKEAGRLQGEAMIEEFKDAWKAMLDAEREESEDGSDDEDSTDTPDESIIDEPGFMPNGILEPGDKAQLHNSKGAGANIYKEVKNKKLKTAIGYALNNTDLDVVAVKGNFARVTGEVFDAKTYERKKMLGWINKSYLKGYALGGRVDFTGPAWLDGTPQRPERVLSAEQNKLFEKFILTLDNMWRAPDLGDTPAAGGIVIEDGLHIHVEKAVEDADFDEMADKIEEALYRKFNVRR